MQATAITLDMIRQACGYNKFDNLRQAWNALFDGAPFPDKNEPLQEGAAVGLLTRLARPYPNKDAAVIQAALRLLEGVNKCEVPSAAHNEQSASENGQNHTPVIRGRKTKPAVIQPAGETSEARARADIMREREAEQRAARERYNAEQAAREQEAAKLNAALSPWITGLTYGLNGLELFFLTCGLWFVAGFMGLIVGAFLAVLGVIVLLVVRLRGAAGGYAVMAWFFVCSIGGWLIEYPAMLYAVEQTDSIVNSDGITYAGISSSAYAIFLTILMGGSSFAGTYFRWVKSNEQ